MPSLGVHSPWYQLKPDKVAQVPQWFRIKNISRKEKKNLLEARKFDFSDEIQARNQRFYPESFLDENKNIKRTRSSWTWFGESWHIEKQRIVTFRICLFWISWKLLFSWSENPRNLSKLPQTRSKTIWFFHYYNQVKFRYAAIFLTKLLDLEFKFFADMWWGICAFLDTDWLFVCLFNLGR